MDISTWLISEEAGLLNPSSWQGAVFYGLLFALLAFALMRGVRLVQRAALHHQSKVPIELGAITFSRQLIEITIFVLAFALYAHLIPELRALGTALLAGVSVASIVIGLAAQATLGNLVAGFSLLLYRPFHLGDRIQVVAPTGTETGTVEDVMLGHTILKTYDNRRIVVPNSLIANQVIINMSIRELRKIAIVPINISYHADLERARAILLELAAAHELVEEILGCPLTDIGPSSLTLSLRAWTKDSDAAWQIRFDLLEQVKKRFGEAGIEMPYPTSKVIVQQGG